VPAWPRTACAAAAPPLRPSNLAVAALSSTLSTAALDKHPQSRERGITLDLGFSAFAAPLPRHLAHLPYNELQFTLVDCPGHASLIRTIIGGVWPRLQGGSLRCMPGSVVTSCSHRRRCSCQLFHICPSTLSQVPGSLI
jgi:hypothetical protein